MIDLELFHTEKKVKDNLIKLVNGTIIVKTSDFYNKNAEFCL